MTRRVLWSLLLGNVILFFVIVMVSGSARQLVWSGHNSVDGLIWRYVVSPRLAAGEVDSVVVRSVWLGVEVELPADEAEWVVRQLAAANFRESNRKHFGSTPSTMLTIRFSDGTVRHYNHWAEGVFESSDAFGSHFVIENRELGAYIERLEAGTP